MSTNPSRLNIIIRCFNSAATIGAQLSAPATQTTRYAWELLIADNGSRDNTIAMATSFRDRINRLAIIDASGRRAAAYARNTGANAAAGESLVRTRADLAQWIWLAGWCGGPLSARRTVRRPNE